MWPFVKNNLSSTCNMSLKILFVTTNHVSGHNLPTKRIITNPSYQAPTSDVLQTSELVNSCHGSSKV